MRKGKLTGAGKSPLTPEQQAKWQDKVESGGIATVVPSREPRYYRMGGGNVARVVGSEYAYLESDTGRWVEHPAVVDAVTGYKGDASTVELTEEQARAMLARFGRTIA